jgi:hypothetical protein
MTLDTTIYIANPTHLRELREFCARQLDIPENIEWYEAPSDIAPEVTLLTPQNREASTSGKGHLAILLYLVDSQNRARRAEVCWDTGSFYRGPNGETAVELHDQLTAELGEWLDAHGMTWHRKTLT